MRRISRIRHSSIVFLGITISLIMFCLALAQNPVSSKETRLNAAAAPGITAVIASASLDGINVTMSGNLAGTPNTTCELEFFSSTECNAASKEDRQSVIGAVAATTDSKGNARFGPVSFPLPSGHLFVTVAAIDPIDKLWMFSTCTLVQGVLPPCFPSPASMTGWWPGENNADDIMNNGNKGTVSKGVSFVPGKVGQAFSFDGVNGTVEIADSPSLNPSKISLSAWIEPNSIKSASRIVTKEMDAMNCVEPDVVYSLELHGDRGDKPAFFFTTSDNVEHILPAKSRIPIAVFTQVAATFDGENAKIYVNGVLENQVAVSGVLASSTMPLVIGNGGQGCRANFAGSVEFEGLIDEVQIFDRAISEEEIRAAFEAGSSGNCKPSPTPTPTPGPDSSPTPTPTATPRPTPTATATPAPTPTASPRAPKSNITWNGGGTTNNWSEGANWTGGVVPGQGDVAIFDATSTKNATIDVEDTGAIEIDSGYTGTITQAAGKNIHLHSSSACAGLGGYCQNSGTSTFTLTAGSFTVDGNYSQGGGTFNGGSNAITIHSNFNQSGGSFNGGSGDIQMNQNFALSGTAQFTSTSGILFIRGGFSDAVAASIFTHNNGTVIFTGPFFGSTLFIDLKPMGESFNNVTFNLDDGKGANISGGAMSVQGNLQLNDGLLNNGTLQLPSPATLSISPNFDGGGLSPSTLLFTGSANRTVTFDSSYHLLNVDLNASGTTINTTGSGTLSFPSLQLHAGTINQGGVDFFINANYDQIRRDVSMQRAINSLKTTTSIRAVGALTAAAATSR